MLKDNVGLYGLEHHIVKISGNIPDAGEPHDKQGKIVLHRLWTLETEFRQKPCQMDKTRTRTDICRFSKTEIADKALLVPTGATLQI